MTDIYCNSCKYAFKEQKGSCRKHKQISDSILNGDLCHEYIRHKDKELSEELANKLDLAISSRFEVSMEEAIAMARSMKHSQCKDCIYGTGFSSCEIYGEKPDKYAFVSANVPCPNRIISIESRIKGALYGFAIGDSMGATTEFMSHQDIKAKYGMVEDIVGGGWLDLKAGEVTDDTQMTLCVCKALEDTIDISNPTKQNDNFFEECCKNFAKWYDTKPADIGNCCRNVISNCRNYGFKEWVNFADNPDSLGNGSLMRSMPLVLAKQSLDTALIQGRLTHNNKECDDCVEEYYLMLRQCLTGELEKESLGLKLQSPTGHVKNTIDNAEFWLFETESVEEAIMGAVNHGGDADTIAAITGSLVGAYYGYYAIPSRWICDLSEEVTKLLDHYAEFFTKIHKAETDWSD